MEYWSDVFSSLHHSSDESSAIWTVDAAWGISHSLRVRNAVCRVIQSRQGRNRVAWRRKPQKRDSHFEGQSPGGAAAARFRPAGAFLSFAASIPRTDVRGYLLSPLRGWVDAQQIRFRRDCCFIRPLHYSTVLVSCDNGVLKTMIDTSQTEHGFHAAPFRPLT